MLSRPTTEQVLRGIADDLAARVVPEVHTEAATALLAQIDVALRGCATRAAHEIAWIHEEADAVAGLTGVDVGWPASLHLDDVVSWYDSVSQVLSGAIADASAAGDATRLADLQALLDARSATELRIVDAPGRE